MSGELKQLKQGNPSLVKQLDDLTDRLQRFTQAAKVGNCLYSGPGRGDCLHFIGLPDVLDKSTTDIYGKPNGWCAGCWRVYENEQLTQQVHDLTAACELLQGTAERRGDRIAELEGELSTKSYCSHCEIWLLTRIEGECPVCYYRLMAASYGKQRVEEIERANKAEAELAESKSRLLAEIQRRGEWLASLRDEISVAKTLAANLERDLATVNATITALEPGLSEIEKLSCAAIVSADKVLADEGWSTKGAVGARAAGQRKLAVDIAVKARLGMPNADARTPQERSDGSEATHALLNAEKGVQGQQSRLIALRDETDSILELAYNNRESIGGSVNWANLYCESAQFVQDSDGENSYRVEISEASPNADKLREFVSNQLILAGWSDVEVQTEW